jgi:hypothetical protein
MAFYDSSVVHFKKAIALNPQSSTTYYYLACSYAKNNKSVDALKTLEQALVKGYNSYEFLIIEPDLESIKKLPEFINLLKKYFPNKYNPKDQE